ncbi:hypothetical protein GCM10023196_080080 [Actinoallomurus vinaceus]|uniref:Lysozyme n=1 Tax=Actinoallomurus vinaceus TaxID=1080074 RepID=A0ABP8UM77_9ACTN
MFWRRHQGRKGIRLAVATAGILAVLAGPYAGAARASSASPPAGRYPVKGVDITEYQHPGGAAVNWPQVRSSGVRFATLKATRGTNIVNPYFKSDLAAALDQGIATAPYHFLIGYDPNTASAQADYFISALKSAGYTGHRRGELPPILDLEWTDDGNSSCPPYTTVAQVQTWLDKVQAAFGVKPMIYTARGFMTGCLGSTTAFGSYLLQVADYTSGHTAPAVPPGWPDWLMWQYADVGSVPGVPTQNVTLDVFNGSEAKLDQLAGLGSSWVSSPVDVNGDGKADIVALDGKGQLWLYPSTGQTVTDHVLAGAVRIGTGWGGFTRMYVSDVTGDGKADVVTLDSKGQLWLYPSTGQTVTDHVLGGPVRIGTGWGGFGQMYVSDITGDAKADIVTLDDESQLWLYPSTGQAVTDHVLSGSVRIGTGWGGFNRLITGDVTGDGKADVVTLDTKGQLWLYPSTGQAVTDHVLSGSVRIGTGWGGFGQMYVSDITGDAKADIVTLDDKGQLWLYPSSGQTVTDHVLSGSVRIGTGWSFLLLLTNGDVNGDKKADIVAEGGDGQLWLYPSSGQGVTDHILSGKVRIGTGWNAFSII